MKILFFILLVSNCYIYGQNLSNDEYEICGQELAVGTSKICQFHLGIPSKYEKTFLTLFKNNEIVDKITKLPIKKWDSIQLSKIILKNTAIDKEFKRLKTVITEKMYFSPILFENNQGYFLQVIDGGKVTRPIFLFLKAQKINEKWIIENHYDIL